MNIDLNKITNQKAASKDTTSAPKVTEEVDPNPTQDSIELIKKAEVQADAEAKPEKTYQHYTSAKPAMKLLTTKGKLIIFTHHNYITDDEECIDYLDAEIKLGLNAVTRGDRLTSAEADPMASFKAQIIKEHEDKKAKEASDKAKGIIPNMGNTKSANAAAINPLGSGGVAS